MIVSPAGWEFELSWSPLGPACCSRAALQRFESAGAGSYDLHVVFIERALEILKPGGRIGFIVPTKWWQASYGAPLRRLLSAGRHYAETFDFGDEQVFEDPSTYTCISLFTKSGSPSLRYHRLSPAALRSEHVERDELRSRHPDRDGPRGAPGSSGLDSTPSLQEHEVPWEDLGDEAWYPGVCAALRPLFDRLRREGPFLGDPAICERVFQGSRRGSTPRMSST